MGASFGVYFKNESLPLLLGFFKSYLEMTILMYAAAAV